MPNRNGDASTQAKLRPASAGTREIPPVAIAAGGPGAHNILGPPLLWFLVSGLLLYLAVPPVDLGFLGFFALVPFLHAALRSSNNRQAALGGFLAGAAFFVPALVWLVPVTVAGWLALALYCAIYFSVFAVTVRGAGPKVLPIAAVWVLLEYVRGAVAFTGFPWLLLSHTQAGFTLFTQILDVTGSYGLSGILVAISVLLYRGGTRKRDALLAGAVLAAVCGYGLFRVQTLAVEPVLRVAMVQASVPQEMKEVLEGRYDPAGVLEKYLSASRTIPQDAGIGMVIWPETVVLSPFLLNVSPSILNERNASSAAYVQDSLRELASRHDAYVLAGATSYLPIEHGYVADPALAKTIPDGSWRRRYNSAYLFDRAGRYVDRYDKIHLVPFGEYIPLPNLLPFLGRLVPFDASLSHGEKQTIFEMDYQDRDLKFGVVICYEDTDAELTRRLRRDGADFIVNISNDAWFGLSELDQHFISAQFRAIENRVGIARSGNNGITAVIDPFGRSGPAPDKNATAAAVDEISTTQSRTVYTRTGDWPWVGAAFAALLWQAARRRFTARSSSMQL